jgi:putative ABC transport system permease protein
MNRMILANLRARPVRTAVSILAVAVEVTLILLVVGLTNGMVRDYAQRVRGIGADIMLRPSGASMFMTMGNNTLPVQLANRLEQQPGIKAATPVAVQANNRSVDSIQGIDLTSFNAVSGGFHFLRGGIFNKPGDVIVDDLYAADHHLHVGSRIELLSRWFTVSGIFEHGIGSRIYLPLQELDDLAGAPGKAAIIYIKLENPKETDAVIARLQKLMPGYSIMPIQQWMSLFTAGNIPMLPLFQHTMIGIAILIGLFVIFLSMYTTILERTRDIGILKALGASKSYIILAIMKESGALAAGGILAGLALAYASRAILIANSPTLPLLFTTGWDTRAAIIAVVAALIGAVYPAMRAARQDPIAALAYE